MKHIYNLFFLIIFSTVIHSQAMANYGKKAITGIGIKAKPYNIKIRTFPNYKIILRDSAALDTTLVHNIYGNLLNDDPNYSKKSSLWLPIIETIGGNVFIWGLNRFALNADYSIVGPKSWADNLSNPYVWDDDRFGVNFVGHPYSGTLSFNAARANGYNYWQSFPFALGGSIMWEFFGENTRQSYNDIVNTPINGAFLGEILFRLSSNVLDDRTVGGNRALREATAFVINPMRGFNRLIQGKTFRKTSKEIYQKEPVNFTVFSGMRKANDDTRFGTGQGNVMLDLQLDYGNCFELRPRKPFDVFRLRADFNIGVGRKKLGSVIGYGLLAGRSTQNEKDPRRGRMLGIFQYYDYWDSKTFELGTVAFGVGMITRYPVKKSAYFYTSSSIAIVPLAGNSTQFGPDTSQVRDYNYGGGLQAKYEGTIDLNWASFKLSTYFYYIQTYVGATKAGAGGANFITMVKPRVTFKLYKSLNIGFEEYVYISDRYANTTNDFIAKTEQKVFLLLYLEDPKRRGRYY